MITGFTKWLLFVFAGLGVALSAFLTAGATGDIAAFDHTRGGYEPSHTDYTGEPADWSKTDVSRTGIVHRGRAIKALFDCTSGMIVMEVFGWQIPFRKISERGIVVRKPREACVERGFAPQF